LSPDTVVHPWAGAQLNFTWYQVQSAVDKETSLTPIQKHYSNDVTYRCFYYPPYSPAGVSDWGTDNLPLSPGTRRYIVHVTYDSGGGNQQLLRSHAPTPGEWGPRETDQDHAVMTRTWSQNCDEPPSTVGPEEFAVRISVRDSGVTSPDPHKQEYLQWLTAYLNTPYSYGGEWFGGWADDKYNTYPVAAYETGIQNHYGCDCSGLVSCGARWAGYNWSPWRHLTSDLNNVSTLIADPNMDLQPGDILNKPGVHVVTVYGYAPGTINQSISSIIHATGGSNDETVIENGVNIQERYLDHGYTPRALVFMGHN